MENAGFQDIKKSLTDSQVIVDNGHEIAESQDTKKTTGRGGNKQRRKEKD